MSSKLFPRTDSVNQCCKKELFVFCILDVLLLQSCHLSASVVHERGNWGAAWWWGTRMLTLNASLLHPCQILLGEPKGDWFPLIKTWQKNKKRLLYFLFKSITFPYVELMYCQGTLALDLEKSLPEVVFLMRVQAGTRVRWHGERWRGERWPVLLALDALSFTLEECSAQWALSTWHPSSDSGLRW